MGHCLYRSFVADLILATTLANTSWWWLTHTRLDIPGSSRTRV